MAKHIQNFTFHILISYHCYLLVVSLLVSYWLANTVEIINIHHEEARQALGVYL
jgi:hypothetical protein